jgi:hypothetical protein
VKMLRMDGSETEQINEIERLRARIADLERELLAVQARANAAVAAAQERAYWLERWHIDLNALMRRPTAQRVRAALKKLRRLVRGARKVKRRLQG